jgi:hypothetical protein
MSQIERRATGRYDDQLKVSVVFEESGRLEGETVNWSRSGILIQAAGRISVQVTVDGQEYQGELVRAFPVNAGTTEYGIKLLTPLTLAEAG